jgi:hypothetical protein
MAKKTPQTFCNTYYYDDFKEKYIFEKYGNKTFFWPYHFNKTKNPQTF